MKSVICAALIVFSLAGCGENSSGVNAGSSASTEASSESAITKVKRLFSGEEAKATVKMSASALISDAIIRGRNGQLIASLKRSQATDTKKELNGFDTDGFLIQFNKDNYKKDPEAWKNEHANYDKVLFDLTVSDAPVEKFKERNRRLNYDDYIFVCVSAQNGWEVSPMREREKALLYMKYIATSCDFTNAVFTEIAAKLGAKTMKDPDEAKAKVQELWGKIDDATLENVLAKATADNESGQFSVDLTGVKGVKFTGKNGVYWNQGYGYTIQNNGVTWFGEGNLSGKQMEFSLTSTIGSALEKSKQTGAAQSSGVGSKTGADVGVK